MPLRIDVRINDKLIERLHIARITKNGMSEGSVNEYAVIRGQEETILTEEYTPVRRAMPEEPTWVEWLEAETKFEHRYGDQSLVCLRKALEALLPDSTSKVEELEDENRRLREEIGAYKHLLSQRSYDKLGTVE